MDRGTTVWRPNLQHNISSNASSVIFLKFQSHIAGPFLINLLHTLFKTIVVPKIKLSPSKYILNIGLAFADVNCLDHHDSIQDANRLFRSITDNQVCRLCFNALVHC